MKEQELDRLLERQTVSEQPSQEKNFHKKIRKTINRTLYTRIFAALLVVALVGTVGGFAVSAGMNALFYDPGREPEFLVSDDRDDVEFKLLLEDALAMYFPGLRCYVLSGGKTASYTADGFARYDVDVLLGKPFDPMVMCEPPTHTFRIERSKLDTGFAPFHFSVNEFLQPDSKPDPLSIIPLETIREEVQGLPASAILDISLSFEEYLTSDEVAQLMRTFPEVDFQWAALKGQATSLYTGVAGGMPLSGLYREQFTPQAEERYPNYYLPVNDEITGEQLEENLCSRLKLLVDHPDFTDLLATQFGDTISRPKLQQRLERAEEEWACYGLRLIVRQQDLQMLLDQLPVSQAWINDVKVSRFQKP